MAFSLVIFDLDETLMPEHADIDAAMMAVCTPVARQHGVDAEILARAVRRQARRRYETGPFYELCVRLGASSFELLTTRVTGPDTRYTEMAAWIGETDFRAESWREGLVEVGIHDEQLARQLSEDLVVTRPAYYSLFDDVLEVLDALKTTHRLAMLTNGIPSIQQAKIEGVNLQSYFEAILISGNIGVGKPDPKTIRAILTRMDIPASDTVMVGDNLHKDIPVAQAVGAYSVWINRHDTIRNDSDPSPDATITGLRDLIPIVS